MPIRWEDVDELPPLITLEQIVTDLNTIAQSLSTLPGRTPQDRQIAADLLMYAVTCLRGHESRLLLDTLSTLHVDKSEVQKVAQAIAALALRLGAYLGRNEE